MTPDHIWLGIGAAGVVFMIGNAVYHWGWTDGFTQRDRFK